MKTQQLHTDRLVLESIAEPNAWELWDLWRDPVIQQHVLSDEAVISCHACDELVATASYLRGAWVIRSPRTHSALGYVSLRRSTPVTPENLDARLMIMLLPVVWGRGYGCESARAVIEHRAAEADVARISATCRADNVRGRVMLDRLGFKALRERRAGLTPQVDYVLTLKPASL